MCLFLSLFGCTVHVKLLVYVCDLPDELMDKPGPEVDDSMDCNGELFLEWEGSSVPKASKKTHLQPHLKQPSTLKSGCIALFYVFKSENCYFLCFPGVFFCFLPKPLTYLACVEIKVIVNACRCFNLELD